jgi:hypothetical protein
MKKILLISSLIVMLVIPYTYAQMGGHGSQERMGMQGHEMMDGMMQNMDQMTGMMKRMTGMMGQSIDEAKMRKMSDIMKDVSEHMMDMSKMMKKGSASQTEMQGLHQQMTETQKRFDMMQRW